MEAKEDYAAADAAQFALGVFPARGLAATFYVGTSFDPLNREIFYSTCWSQTGSTVANTTGFPIWTGVHNIASPGNYNELTYNNFAILKVNVDTFAVTSFSAYDSASTVPNGIGGSTGTSRRFVEAAAEQFQGIKIVDPRNRGVWSHHFAPTTRTCLIYNFRFEDDYALTLSPYVPSANRHLELFGITDDWVYVGDSGKDTAGFYTLELIPRVRTAAETAADFLLSYASFEMPSPADDYYLRSCLAGDGRMFVLGRNFNAVTNAYRLWRFDPPTSAPFGGPVVGGGWTEVTPWAVATGPNTLSATFDGLTGRKNLAACYWLRAPEVAVCLSLYTPRNHTPVSTDPLDFHYQCTYFRPSDGAWSYAGDFVSGYMTAAWTMTADPMAAAWAIIDDRPVREFDNYRDFNSYDYSADIPGDDDSLRTFLFQCRPVLAGAVGGPTTRHAILAQYRFAYGVAPALVRKIDERGWDDAYPAYGAAITNTNVVEASMNDPAVDDPPPDFLNDNGLSPAGEDVWWFSGQSYDFFEFNATFTNRLAGGAGWVSPPLLRLSAAASGSGRRAYVWSQIGAPQLRSHFAGPVPPASAPVNVVLPYITGSVVVGGILTVSNGTWTGAPTSYARQWLRDGASIDGATATTRVLTVDDDGADMSATVTAANGIGSAPATSLGAGPVGPAPSAPASVATPVVGTDLTAVWNLKYSGTGPRSGPTNGTYAGSLDAYLIGKGFIIGNDNGALWLNIGSSTVTVTNYNFLNCPRIQVRGTGTVNFVDCTLANVENPDAGFRAPININGGPTGENITVNFTYCDMNITTFYSDTGTWTWDHCRFRNQKQMIWGSAGAEMLCVDCYVTGGGCNPPTNSHVELIQYNASVASGLKFKWLRVMCNFTDGQATISPWGSGWTAVFTSPLGGMIELADSIITGVIAMNANPLFPTGMVAYGVTYNFGNLLISNCVLDIAQYGYTSGNGTPLTQSGNRTFANVALVPGDFG